MPRRAASGAKGLYKQHHCGTAAARPTKCDCQWRGQHKGKRVVLAKWAGVEVDPRTLDQAEQVLGRFKTAVDEGTFDPTGERPAPPKSGTSLAGFIEEWTERYATERKLSMASLGSMLTVIADSPLGTRSLKELAGATEDIETWLNARGRVQAWGNKTWNEYHGLLGRLFTQAVAWKRMVGNPVVGILRRVALEPEQFKVRHLVEDVEDQLFAACKLLNVARPASTRGKLTQVKANAIRAALATGAQGKDVAARFGVSPAVVSSIKHGDIWKGEARPVGTKGTEMERRLVAAFDGGLRAHEMQQIKLQHVSWRLVVVRDQAGAVIGQGYIITLTPDMTKGGKRTGKNEEVFAGTPRFVQLLEQRRFALKNNPPSRQFIFGTEDGRYQKGFRRMWVKLFEAAGLEFGRDKGLVWHTTRHEFISRVAENTGDPVLTQKVARHKQLKTTQGYFHSREERAHAAVAGLARR